MTYDTLAEIPGQDDAWIQPPPPAGTPPTIERSKDGYWIDVDSGEVLGHEELESAEEVYAVLTLTVCWACNGSGIDPFDDGGEPPLECPICDGTGRAKPMVKKPPFAVTDIRSAEWVLGKMMDADGVVVGLKSQRAALVENIDRMIAQQTRRREWLDRRFSADLEAFASAELEGRKGRSITTPYGTIGFRKSVAKIVIKNMEAAVEFCESWSEETHKAVKVVKSVLVSLLKGHEQDVARSAAFEFVPAGDKFYVKTGVEE